jgi:hypothetical protein
MSHDSLAELRNPHFDKQTYSLTLSEREPEIISHYDAKLLRAELFVITASNNFYGPGLAERRPTRPSRKVFAAFGHLYGISNTI